MPDELLFYPNDLSAALEGRRREMDRAIADYDGNRLLNTDEDALVTYFAKLAFVEPLALRDDEIAVDQAEAKYDVRHRFDYAVWDQSRPQYVPATRVSLHVPFNGDADLFKFKASTWSVNPPRAEVNGSELIVSYTAPHQEASGAKQHFDDTLRRLREGIGWINSDVAKHNAALPARAREAVQARRRRLLENQQVVASLGYPLRQRADAPQTYSLPSVRQKAVPARPPASSAPFVPEPALDTAVYEHILRVMGNMVRVMEQSPDAFANMKEEDLRTHFLVQLNGQFEGRASAETFRGSGATDILLIEQDKSVFIAECKFWKGPESLSAAIEQLLDYATWRDAKTAILLFSRNADFTNVVRAIPDTLKEHPHTVGTITAVAETVFRSRLRQRGDPNRLLTVTTLAYNVPANRPRSQRLSQRNRKAP
jgi:hypothetical protein